MSRAIAYYTGGKKPILEMLVSIYTLRQHYSGEIAVCLGETSLPYAEPIINNKLGVEVIIVPDSANDKTLQQHWGTRWRAMALCRQDQILHPDCDTIVLKNIDHLFDYIHPDPETITSYYMWNDGEVYWKWEEHKKEYEKICPITDDMKPLYFGFGIVGWNKGWPHFQEVSDNMKVLPTDEMSMSLTLMRRGRKGCMAPVTPDDFKLARAYYRLEPKDYHNTKIWHLPGRGPLGYNMWWREFLKAREAKAFSLDDDAYLSLISKHALPMIKDKTWPTSTYADHRKREGLSYE